MSDDQSELAAARRRVAELEAKAKAVEQPRVVENPVAQGGGGLSSRSVRWLLGGVAMVAVLATCSQLVSRAPKPATEAAPEVAGDWKAEALAVKPLGDAGSPAAESPSLWRYSLIPDAMKGKTGTLACVTSSDQVTLDWPYKTQQTELCIRRSSQYGLDVYLALPEGGQFICQSYNGCSVQVRFDDGTAARYPAVDAADGSTDLIFIRRAETFLAKIKVAKITRIEAQYYQAGNQVSTFPTKGLDAEQLALKTVE